MPQSTGWFSVRNCSVALRCSRTSSESVSTRWPSATGMLHAISTQFLPSGWTTQMRQLPAIDRFGCQQKYGMKKPLRSAVCRTVSSSRACTAWPLMKISGMERHLEIASELRALVLDEVFELVAILGEDADRRVARRVAHPADRRAVVQLRDRDQALDVLGPAVALDDAVDDPVHPAHAFATRRALAARLVVIEAQHHLQQAHHAGVLGDDDHAARAERRPRPFQRFLVVGERLAFRGGQHLGR